MVKKYFCVISLALLAATGSTRALAEDHGSQQGQHSEPQQGQEPKTSTVPIPANFNAVDKAILSHFDHLMDHSRVASKCLNCHQNQYRDVSQSIHGKAGLLKGLPEGSICLTCHEVNHIVRDPSKIQNYQLDPFVTIPQDVACMRCHGDETIGAAFKFPPHVPSEFEHSIHYRKARVGDHKAPLCADCHGNHNIVRVDNPSSPVYEAQRVKVCAKCHPGANATFASVFDHTPITMDKKPLEFWTITLFKVLTLGTFLALGFYLLLDIVSLVRDYLLPWIRREPRHPHAKSQKYVMRLPFHLRLQHFLMLTSVITLCTTAFPLLAPDSPVSQSMMRALGGVHTVAMIHRFFGFVMISDFIYHIVYLYMQFRAGGRMHPMMPMPHDLIHIWEQIQYFFGLREKRPEFDQFAFHEKFDYWAVFWGVPMLGGSGIILTFPTFTAHILPGWAIRLANIVHADEALLAAMVLFIWHFYNVHLKPGIFPMNWAWLTGRMRSDIYEHEHGGHVNKLKKQGKWEE